MHLAHDPAAAPAPTISFDQFQTVDIRVGTIIDAQPFPEARKPAFKLKTMVPLTRVGCGMTAMRGLLVTGVMLLAGWDAAAQQPLQAQQDNERLAAAIGQAATHDIAWVTAQATAADIVLIGEAHGSAGIARMAEDLARDLAAAGTTVYATEISPTAALAPLLGTRDDGLDAYMSDARRAFSHPFFHLREEAEVARAILERKGNSALWGLDQEFIAAGPVLTNRLNALARSQRQRAAVDAAQPAFTATFMALGKISPEVFAALKTGFQGAPEALTLIDEAELSNTIYGTQGYDSNRRREELMKRNFLRYWRAAGAKPPRILMKFGAYHLTAGLSPTMVPSMGGFVRDVAALEDKRVFSVLILCGPDGAQRRFDGSVESCKADFEAAGGALAPYLAQDGPTVVRTAPLRAIPGTLRRLGWTEDVRNYVFSYDALVVVKDSQPATPFVMPLAEWFSNK